MNRNCAIAGVLLLAGCGNAGWNQPDAAASAQAAHDSTDAAHGAANAVIQVPASVRRNLGLNFAVVQMRSVADMQRLPGVFELEPRARREYRKGLPGTVELMVDQYQEVKAGQLLFRYRSPSWTELTHGIVEGEQRIESAQAEIEVAEAALSERDTGHDLLEQRVAELEESDSRRADLELKLAELQASAPRLEAELARSRTDLANARRSHAHALRRAAIASGQEESELNSLIKVDGALVRAYEQIVWIEVAARAAGIVEQLAVTDGAFVDSPGLVLVTIDPGQIRFRATALQGDLGRLRLPGAHGAAILAPGADGGGARVAATLALGLEADPIQRTVDIIASPAEFAAWMRPGTTTFLEIQTEAAAAPELAVPSASVVTDGLERVVFLRNRERPNEVIRTPVELGPSDGRWTVLTSGVARGDEVVLGGAYEIRLASQQGGLVQPGGHMHADGTFHSE